MTRRVFILMGLFAFVGPAAARACACSKASPGACASLQKDDVVFLGTVTKIEAAGAAAGATTAASNSNGADGAPPSSSGASAGAAPITRYHFKIDERFAGPDTEEIDVFSGGDDGDCGYRFMKGEQYIVFTQQEVEGRLFATTCSGTRPANEGRALLPQLRAMRGGNRVASVFGVLRRANPPFLAQPDDPDDPLPNIALKLRSRDDRFTTSTDANGVYSFYDVHAGEYRFTANLPTHMELTQKTLPGGLPPFKIPNDACYEYDVDALPTGHIRGSVLGPDGKPLTLASVELYRADQYKDTRPGLWGFQGSKGVFDFDHVGPGKYILVFNRMNRMDPNSPFPRTFYPGTPDATEAEPIELQDGQQVLKANIALQNGFPTRQIRVHVKWQQGMPPGQTTVIAKADRGDNPAAQKTADGLYQFTLLASARYTIYAWEDLLPQRAVRGGGRNRCAPPARIETQPVTLDGSDEATEEITLNFPALECANP
ncbi:MAG TPA: hypothetical protein VN044_01215 [Verrucomicrobiae bacterium]|nr:hypothetical protein [Verrucomicrobiae bacterium]